MQWRRHLTGLTFSFVFVVSYFTNKAPCLVSITADPKALEKWAPVAQNHVGQIQKFGMLFCGVMKQNCNFFGAYGSAFVLSVLKFTYPTLFQGWQTFIGAVLLLLSGKLGWVEMSRINRSAALYWLPGSVLFVGNIYAGSRALSRIDIPYFFTLQNSSHVVSYIISTVVLRERVQQLTFISLCLMLFSAINLPSYDPQFDYSGYLWAIGHLFCVGAYRVFQVRHKPSNLSDLEQQCINYLFSVLLLAIAAHPTGDLMGALEFPSLTSYTFHCGCCASALLGFLLLLATVKLKNGFSLEHFGVWIFMSKVTAMSLSPFIFNMDVNAPALMCVVVSHVAEALLLYSERESQLGRG